MYDEETEEYIGNVEELTGKIADLTKTASTPGGITLFTDETKTEYKSTYQLLKDISVIYHDLTDKDQAALLETLAGKRGGQVLAGILDDFSEVEKAMDEMSKAAGSADEEMKIVEESISFKLNALKETWVGLLQEMLNRGTIDEIIDMLIKLSEAIVKVVEANPKAAFAGIAALIGVGKAGGFKSIAETISGLGNISKSLGDFSKFIKGATDASTAAEVVADDWLKIAAAGGDVTEAFATTNAAIAGFNSVTGEATVASSGLLGVLGPLVAVIAAIGIGVIAWDHFTTTVEEAESKLKDTENIVSDLQKEVDELNNIENRTDGQEKRLQLLQSELDYQKKILEVRQEILAKEKYGDKFSDQFDPDNAYTQYTTDKTNRYEVNNSGDFVKIGTAVKENIQLIQQYQKKSEEVNLSEKERQKYLNYVDKQRGKLEGNYEKYLSEILDYQQKKDAIQQDIDAGYLQQGDESYERAKEMLAQYSTWIQQDEAIVKDIEKALGKYDYVQDDIKSLASNWETGSISASSIADTLINHMQGFSEAEKAAFYDSIKNAKGYAEALDIINGKQNEIADSVSNIGESTSWDLGSSLESYDIDAEEFNKYLAAFKELNPELAKNEDLIDQIALANYRFYQSSDDLKANLDDYIQTLRESDTSSIQYGNTIKSLTYDLSALTGVDFSITDTQSFLDDRTNLTLLQKAIEGDNEALNVLRDNANRNIIIRIATDAHINTDEFYRQYQDLVRYLDSHPGLDKIEVKSYLDNSEFIKSCNQLISEGKLTSNELTQIISNMSLKIQDSLPDFEKWSKKTKEALTFTQSISDLNDLSNSLNNLGTAIANIDQFGNFQLGDLDSIADYFLGLDEAKYDIEAVSDALKMLGEGSGSVEQQADAINILADNYLHTSNILDGVNEKNKQLYITRLREMGIINAETIVEQTLAGARQQLIQYEEIEAKITDDLKSSIEDLDNVSLDEIDTIRSNISAILDEGDASDSTRAAIFELVSQQTIFNNNSLSVNDKIEQLEKLAQAFLNTADAARYAADASKLSAEAKNLEKAVGGGMPTSDYNAAKKRLEGQIQDLTSSYTSDIKKNNNTVKYERAKYNGGSPVKNRLGETPKSTSDAISGVANKAAEEAAEAAKKEAEAAAKEAEKAAKEAEEAEKEIEDTYDEFFDYFEQRVKIISDAISLLNSNLENVVGSSAKNKLLEAQQNIFKMQQQEYEGAKNMYQQMADRALSKLPDDIKNNLINGAVAIDEFIGSGNKEVVEAIQEYQKWADKIADCKQELAELKEQIRQLELTRFKNIMQDFQDAFDLRQNNAIDLINKQISLFEEAGELIGDDFYKKQKEQTERQVSAMEQARKELIAEINRGLGNGTIEIGSDEWLEMTSILSDVEGKILDCKKAIEEYDNAILNIHVNVFERIQTTFSNFSDELSDVASFLEDVDVGDKLGNWSKEGIARAGLLAQQYELAKYQANQYQEEIEWLNAQYNAGKYSTVEYMDRLAELTSRQRDAALSAEEYKDSIVELNKARINLQIEGINDEIDAYKELIDAQKKALASAKDLHDYEKQIADANKSIVELEKQIAAMRNDDSAASIAKRKKLEQQLSDARASLTEQEYQHSIEAQEDALDQQFENYQEQREAEIDKLNEYVKNIEQVLTDTFENIKENATSIGETITQTAQEHGIQISDSLTTAWQAGSDAIASYGQTLSASSSEFIGNLNNVTNETWELQEQANQTSVGLADMFANRADNLVDELQRSWDSESNLDNMTHALGESFVDTINTASGIREVVNPINDVESATNSLDSAVKNLGNDVRDLGNDLVNTTNKANDFTRAWNEAASAEEEYWRKHEEEGNYLNGDLMTRVNTSDYTPDYKTYYKTGNYRTIKYSSGHAKGLSNAQKDELAWTQELGDEVIISPTRSSILTPIKKGDSVIDAKGTSNLFELAKIDPQKILNGMALDAPSTIQQNKAFGITISNLVNVEGSVNDSMAMMKIAAQQAQNKIAKTLKDLNDEIKY